MFFHCGSLVAAYGDGCDEEAERQETHSNRQDHLGLSDFDAGLICECLADYGLAPQASYMFIHAICEILFGAGEVCDVEQSQCDIYNVARPT